MKKLLISLLAIVTIFTITGCGSKENSEKGGKDSLHPNQTGYVESTTINGNEWYKGVTDDNAYIYYIQNH